MPTMSTEPCIGIIGGTGVGCLLADATGLEDRRQRAIDTPFGPPSGPIMTGNFGPLSLALLSRHGDGHLLNPSQVPYGANIFALKSLGCTHIIATGATGSLRDDIHPGELVICDQLIDRTHRRQS